MHALSRTKEETLVLERQARWKKLSYTLRKLFPNKKTMLDYSTMWELVVAVILSAQCTDKQVNKVTEKLFKKYITLHDYVVADEKIFQEDIRSTGFYKSKTKHILSAAKTLSLQFHGIVPQTIAELTQLAGVGRKTANVVLSNGFNKSEGIAVDTHVRRFALRYGLTDSKDPKKIEQDLMAVIPRKEWISAVYYMIQYGRELAPARTYNTATDPLVQIYPPAGKIFRI